MSDTIAQLNYILALGGVGLICATVILVFDVTTKNFSLRSVMQKYALVIALMATLGSTAMTLLYSEVFGFIPCGLCWLQRVFLYPQVLLLALAVYKKDTHVVQYGILLSIAGIIVSLYQHYLQMGGLEFITCPITGADCAERILFEFGFVTFPLISAFLFSFLIAIYWYVMKIERNPSSNF